jgi:prepilin-type N-terminal cleavage/methylation domain-containing protein
MQWLRKYNVKFAEHMSRCKIRDHERGFSLLELMISVVLFVLVSGTVFGLLQVARQGRAAISENSGLNRNVRVALNLIGRDTYNAGYGFPLRNTVILPDNRLSALLNIPNDYDTSRDTIAPIVAGNNLHSNSHSTVTGTLTDQITFLFKDTTFNVVGTGDAAMSQPLNINAATTTSTGIDEIVPLSGSNAACRVNDIYLVTGNTGSTLGVATALAGTNRVQFANGDVLGFNQTGTSGPLRQITVPASIQRVIMVTYFVTADGTLTRREYANRPPVVPAVAFVDQPLVYGVENFQVQYILDDGSLTDNPSAGPNGIPGDEDDTPINLAAVRQVRITIAVRSIERNAAGEPFKLSMTSTFSTRNLGYDAN